MNKMAAVTNIDTTGIHSLEDLLTNLNNKKIQVLICFLAVNIYIHDLLLHTFQIYVYMCVFLALQPLHLFLMMMVMNPKTRVFLVFDDDDDDDDE